MMSPQNDDFFIGWKDSPPPEYKSTLRKLLVPILLLLPVLTYLIVQSQTTFNDYQFEFGDIKTFTGIYQSHPVPLLHSIQADHWPPNTSKTALLVGYGKFGAAGIMKDIAQEKGNLDGQELSIKGTLIYGDGKSLIELTEEQASVIAINASTSSHLLEIKNKKPVQLKGEIIDPKCYFGVMKPGEGKVHKSCAIRCISGGIPPVLRSGSAGAYIYSILLDTDGAAINKAVLPYVAESIQLNGTSATLESTDWQVVYTEPSSFQFN